jgi:hypothetical protein
MYRNRLFSIAKTLIKGMIDMKRNRVQRFNKDPCRLFPVLEKRKVCLINVKANSAKVSLGGTLRMAGIERYICRNIANRKVLAIEEVKSADQPNPRIEQSKFISPFSIGSSKYVI